MLKKWLAQLRARKQRLMQETSKPRYIVIDLELTGLDAKQHEIVSIAWVVIEHQCIKLSRAQHKINNQVRVLEQSPVYHGISRSQITQGEELSSILTSLSQQFYDGILVFHNALLDWSFLKVAFKANNIAVEPMLIVDTLQLEKKRLQHQGQEIALDDLTLQACRARYQLPHYSHHHALTDAIGTAELLLAQCHRMSAGKLLKVKDLL